MRRSFLDKKIPTKKALNCILFFFILLPHLLPVYFVEKLDGVPIVWTAMSYFSIGLMGVYILRSLPVIGRKKIVSFPIVFLFFLIYALLILSTFLNDGDVASAITHGISVLLFCLVATHAVSDPNESASFLYVLRYLSAFFCLINIGLMFLLPSGLSDNSAIPVFLYGNVNSTIRYLLPGLCASVLLDYKHGKRISLITLLFPFCILYCCFRIYFMGTAFVGILVFFGWLFFAPFISKRLRFVYSMVLVVVFLVEIVVVITSDNTGLNQIIADVFHKSIDFSGRRSLWRNAMDLFLRNPHIGTGELKDMELSAWIGNTFGAHNYYLDLLYQRGWIGTLPFIMAMLLPVFLLKKGQQISRNLYVLFGVCCSLYFMFLAEPFYAGEIRFMPFLFILLNQLILSKRSQMLSDASAGKSR